MDFFAGSGGMDGFTVGPVPRHNLLAFLDETGGYDLTHIDPTFPVFVASTVLCSTHAYWTQIVPAVQAFRTRYCGGPVILHSRDIRKQQKGFSFLVDPVKRAAFYQGLNTLMQGLPARYIAAAVHTQRHLSQYGPNAFHPYEWALALTLERLFYCAKQTGAQRVHVIAEARTPTLDTQLRVAFNQTLAQGTAYLTPRRFAEIAWDLTFRTKRQNIIGTQLADLVGYPVARHVIDPTASHPSMPVINPKFLTAPDGRMVGLKIVP